MKKYFLILLFLLFINSSSNGSQCIKFTMPVIRDYIWLPLIFTGTVIKIEKPEIHPHCQFYKMVTFKIDKIYKGDIKVKYIKVGILISYGAMQAACPNIIKNVNEKWLIFTYTRDKDYYITSGGTKSAESDTREYSENIFLLEDIIKRKNGYNKFYGIDSKLVAEGNFINKFPDSYWNFYDDNGLIKEKVFYKMGKIDSINYRYTKGKLETKSVYKNEKELSYTHFDSNGYKLIETRYHYNIYSTYDTNWNEIFIERQTQNELGFNVKGNIESQIISGDNWYYRIIYDKNRNINYFQLEFNGNKIGPCITYNDNGKLEKIIYYDENGKETKTENYNQSIDIKTLIYCIALFLIYQLITYIIRKRKNKIT